MRRVIGVVAVACLTACSLLVDTGGLHDGAPVPSGDDANPPVDGGARDGPLGDDATADAALDATDGDAPDAPLSPCALPSLFCDDFDTGPSDPAGRWDSMQSAAGPLSFDTATFRSAPRSLRVAITAGTGGRASELAKRVTGLSGSVVVELDVLSGGPTGTYGEVDPIAITLEPPPPSRTKQSLAVIFYSDGLYFENYRENPNQADNQKIGAFPSKWAHVRIAVSMATKQAVLTIDDAVVATVLVEGSALTGIVVGTGAPYTNDVGAPWTFNFDNVRVTKP